MQAPGLTLEAIDATPCAAAIRLRPILMTTAAWCWASHPSSPPPAQAAWHPVLPEGVISLQMVLKWADNRSTRQRRTERAFPAVNNVKGAIVADLEADAA
jgi:hypothetical protein